MRTALFALAALSALCFSSAQAQEATPEAPRWSLAIHGGAGVIERAGLTLEQDAAYRDGLTQALAAGSALLERGGSSLDAVQAAIQVLEDDPLFNAGRGAAFTAAGRNELDAAVMNGSDLTAGSVAGLTTTRHPIAVARAVMEQSPHVMLIGPGADAFATHAGLEQVDPVFFFTERRWQGLVKALTEAGQPIPDRLAGGPTADTPGAQAAVAPPLNEKKFGTVGAVALDSRGRLAAGTSTGGMTAKRWGRVGDVPIIGAGTYASNADGCAVSATGSGEYFIRATVARDICARVGVLTRETPDARFDRQAAVEAAICGDPKPDEICMTHEVRPVLAAARAEIAEVGELGGEGGVIVMGLDGYPAFVMNTSGMYRGAVASNSPARVAIYADEN